jgi:hypothetical protein
MTINPFDLMALAGFMAVGLWLETVGGKHGIADDFFAPIPLTAPAAFTKRSGVLFTGIPSNLFIPCRRYPELDQARRAPPLPAGNRGSWLEA